MGNRVKENKAVPTILNVVNVRDGALNNLVHGMIFIQQISAILQFNFGCTYSFRSYSMVRKLNLKPRMLEPILIVITLNRGKTIVDEYVSSIIMNVMGKSIVWDLEIYHLMVIDVILGLYWLSKNDASWIVR